MIELASRTVRCTVEPALGGAILGASVDGRNLLRQSPSQVSDILATACFPLVPFANRIASGRMLMHADEIVLPADPAALPHAHHGHGWRRPWTISARDAHSLTLEYQHAADAWPWRYTATQQITLTDRGIEIVLTVQNIDDSPMPAGLGLHPYFPRTNDAVVILASERMLLNDAMGLPLGEGQFGAGRRPLNELEGLDTLLLGEPTAEILIGSERVLLEAEGAIGFHVYVPSGQNFFCVEPVSHRPNAFAKDGAAFALDPGSKRRLSMRLTAV